MQKTPFALPLLHTWWMAVAAAEAVQAAPRKPLWLVGWRGPQLFVVQHDSQVVHLTRKLVFWGGIYNYNTRNVGWQMSPPGEDREVGGCWLLEYLDSTADAQEEEEERKKLPPTSVNTELALSSQNVFQMHCQREPGKTTQHHRPWLQIDIDDEALQSVIMS